MRFQFTFRTLLAACIVLLGMKALAQDVAPDSLNWNGFKQYDKGEQTSIAFVPSSNVFVEFHKSQNNDAIWYHTGKVTEPTSGNITTTFGPSRTLGINGAWPAVAVTWSGYVIVVNSTVGETYPRIRYSIGRINPDGNADQTISWYIENVVIGYGYHPSISVNSDYTIAIAYECRSDVKCWGDHELHYRLGHLRGILIDWNSGADGIQYDKGVDPHIAINDSGQAIEVHQAGANDEKLHYRRGTLNPTSISFQESTRYDNSAKDPAVALTNSGQVVAVDIEPGKNNYPLPMARTGTLDTNNPAVVNWTDPVLIGSDTVRYNVYPAVTNNGNYALATWTATDVYWYTPDTLYFNVAPLN